MGKEEGCRKTKRENREGGEGKDAGEKGKDGIWERGKGWRRGRTGKGGEKMVVERTEIRAKGEKWRGGWMD